MSLATTEGILQEIEVSDSNVNHLSVLAALFDEIAERGVSKRDAEAILSISAESINPRYPANSFTTAPSRTNVSIAQEGILSGIKSLIGAIISGIWRILKAIGRAIAMPFRWLFGSSSSGSGGSGGSSGSSGIADSPIVQGAKKVEKKFKSIGLDPEVAKMHEAMGKCMQRYLDARSNGERLAMLPTVVTAYEQFRWNFSPLLIEIMEGTLESLPLIQLSLERRGKHVHRIMELNDRIGDLRAGLTTKLSENMAMHEELQQWVKKVGKRWVLRDLPPGRELKEWLESFMVSKSFENLKTLSPETWSDKRNERFYSFIDYLPNDVFYRKAWRRASKDFEAFNFVDAFRSLKEELEKPDGLFGIYRKDISLAKQHTAKGTPHEKILDRNFKDYLNHIFKPLPAPVNTIFDSGMRLSAYSENDLGKVRDIVKNLSGDRSVIFSHVFNTWMRGSRIEGGIREHADYLATQGNPQAMGTEHEASIERELGEMVKPIAHALSAHVSGVSGRTVLSMVESLENYWKITQQLVGLAVTEASLLMNLRELIITRIGKFGIDKDLFVASLFGFSEFRVKHFEFWKESVESTGVKLSDEDLDKLYNEINSTQAGIVNLPESLIDIIERERKKDAWFKYISERWDWYLKQFETEYAVLLEFLTDEAANDAKTAPSVLSSQLRRYFGRDL